MSNPPLAKARDIPGLHAELSYREAAARTVDVRARELFEPADGVLDTSDIERVHDMRVATRRLRAVLEIYEPCFPRKQLRAALSDVKALADVLGERRDPDVQLAHNLQRIVAARLDELQSFIPKALDPAEVKALHDMRIAAKRLRYILEVAAEPCFGAYAQTAIKRTKDLQDLLGELHDCDVQLPRVRALHDELRAADALEARARAGDAPDLDPTLASGTPPAGGGRGWEPPPFSPEPRRGLLFERFLDLWRSLERDGFRARLQYAIAERPIPVTPASPEGNGAGPPAAIPLPETDG